MLYNWTSADGIIGLFQLANNMTGQMTMNLIVLSLMIIMMFSLLFAYGAIISLVSTGSIMFFMSLLLLGGGLVNPFLVFLNAIMLGLGILWHFMASRT